MDNEAIKEQIESLDGFLYSIKKTTNWGKEYGTYAPLEQRINDLEQTLELLLAIKIAVDKLGAEVDTWAEDAGGYTPAWFDLDEVLKAFEDA